MRGQIAVVEKKKYIYVYSPYSPSNIAQFKLFRGKWLEAQGCWEFVKSSEVKKMLTELFGEDSPGVKARLFEDRVEKSPNAWQIGGYVIHTRKGPEYPLQHPFSVIVRGFPPQRIVELIVRKDFADREKLEIIATDDPKFAEERLVRLGKEQLAKEEAWRASLAARRADQSKQ